MDYYKCDGCGIECDKDDLEKIGKQYICEACLKLDEEIQEGIDFWAVED